MCWKCSHRQVERSGEKLGHVFCSLTNEHVTDFYNPPEKCVVRAYWEKDDAKGN